MGRTKQWRGNCSWQINPSQGFSPVEDSALSLTPLGFLGHGSTSSVELSLCHVDASLGAARNRGPDALELLLWPEHQGALVLWGSLPPPRISPTPSGLWELLQGCRLYPQVPARSCQSQQGCPHPAGKNRAGRTWLLLRDSYFYSLFGGKSSETICKVNISIVVHYLHLKN